MNDTETQSKFSIRAARMLLPQRQWNPEPLTHPSSIHPDTGYKQLKLHKAHLPFKIQLEYGQVNSAVLTFFFVLTEEAN